MAYLKFHTGGPAKTFALSLVLVLGLGCLAGYLGFWVAPVFFAIAHDGWSGLAQVRVVNYTPQPPDWVGPHGSLTRWLTGVAYFIPVIAGLAIGGLFGERLYRYLVIEKLRWLTREQVDEARRNEKQYF